MAHVPVLLDETIRALAVRDGGLYVDGTLGRAGHTRAILSRGGHVLGIDRDQQAIDEVLSWKAANPSLAASLTIVKGNQSEMARLVAAQGWTHVDGVLLDLGVSSPQLDEAARGFSFMREGPLDMRMDRARTCTAEEIVNGSCADELEDLFRRWGEEPQARRIARAVAAEVAAGRPFRTTTALADFIERLVGRRGAKHPATRVFQALRMAVNDEEAELEAALTAGLHLLAPGGRFAVITFESLTDRLVKQFFAAHVGREVSLQQGGSRWEGEEPRARAVTRKAVVASEAEKCHNVRSRSAKLRVIERI